MFRFNRNYFFVFLLLLLAEVIIALFIRDRIIRPYIGDLLVVILIYCFIKSFWNGPVLITAAGVLAFAYIVELLQYLQIADRLGLTDHQLAKIIIGNTFQWMDLLAYTIGIVIVLFAEYRWRQRKTPNGNIGGTTKNTSLS